MAATRFNEPIEPMTLGLPVPTFGPRMVCTQCGIIGADARPNWREQPQRESLTGTQWRGEQSDHDEAPKRSVVPDCRVARSAAGHMAWCCGANSRRRYRQRYLRF